MKITPKPSLCAELGIRDLNKLSLLLFISAVSSLMILTLILIAAPVKIAQAQETPIDNEQMTDPQPQTPNEIIYAYNDQMTPEEVSVECDHIDGLITAEAERITTNIEPFKISHPDYYVTEEEKIATWQQATETDADAECQSQKQAADERQPPPPQVPAEIPYDYNNQMTPEEVIEECTAIDHLIATEFNRLTNNIRPYETSHPVYYAAEKTKLEAWFTETSVAAETECQSHKETADERQVFLEDIDNRYPNISDEIKALAAELGLTDEAKIILYDNNPRLFNNANNPDFTCGVNSLEEVYIHGCWDHRGSMKVLRDNSTSLTIAHELLHVIYYDYYQASNNDEIDGFIDTVVANNPRQTEIILRAYNEQIANLPAQSARYIEYTELYAFIGTQFTNIPSGMETHYDLYFKNRDAVVDIFLDWVIGVREKITEQAKYNQLLVDQAAEYIECLNDINRLSGNCAEHQPDQNQYSNYDDCLVSRKTFLADCQQLRPSAFLAYELAPPITMPPVDDNQEQEDVQERIDEAEELVNQINAEQTEIEESFIHQLVFYDHDLEGTDNSRNQDSSDTSRTNRNPATTNEADEGNATDDREENSDTQLVATTQTNDEPNPNSQLANVDLNQPSTNKDDSNQLFLGSAIAGGFVLIAVFLIIFKIYRQRQGITEEDLTLKQ